jgi:hypothetical protein
LNSNLPFESDCREVDACNDLPHRRFERYRVDRHLGCALHLCRPRSDRVALSVAKALLEQGAAAQVNRHRSRVSIQCAVEVPMVGLSFRRIYRRTIAAGGILALAWWVTGAAPLWNAGLMNSAPQFTVIRFRKDNRLPMTRTPAAAHDLAMPQSVQKKLPLGCDPAFSPVASPASKSVYGRCMV